MSETVERTSLIRPAIPPFLEEWLWARNVQSMDRALTTPDLAAIDRSNSAM
jgi:hypothetical protein